LEVIYSKETHWTNHQFDVVPNLYVNMREEGINTMIGINGAIKTIIRQVWKFNAFDGNDQQLMFRIVCTLNSAAMALTTGSIVKVSSYFPIVSTYFNYGEPKDPRCAIVACLFLK